MTRKNPFRMQFFVRERDDYRFDVRIYRRRDIAVDTIVDTLSEAQLLINNQIERSML